MIIINILLIKMRGVLEIKFRGRRRPAHNVHLCPGPVGFAAFNAKAGRFYLLEPIYSMEIGIVFTGHLLDLSH